MGHFTTHHCFTWQLIKQTLLEEDLSLQITEQKQLWNQDSVHIFGMWWNVKWFFCVFCDICTFRFKFFFFTKSKKILPLLCLQTFLFATNKSKLNHKNHHISRWTWTSCFETYHSRQRNKNQFLYILAGGCTYVYYNVMAV